MPAQNAAASNAGVKYFEGVIARAEDDGKIVTVALLGGAEVTFPFEQVDRAHLKFEW